MFNATVKINYMNGTCHPRICHGMRFFQFYPKIKPRNIFHVNSFRCYTFSLPASIKTTGITKLLMVFNQNVDLKIHTRGMFFMTTKYINIGIEKIGAVLKYDIFEQLNTKDKPCSPDPEYSKDDCILQQIYFESMKKFGCTTPFGLDKTSICLNKTIGGQARLFYDEQILTDSYPQICPNPCSTLTPTFSITSRSDNAWSSKALLSIEFPTEVKVIQAYPAYTFLSLIAEVGGYVGLFLGISVLDLKGLFSYFS